MSTLIFSMLSTHTPLSTWREYPEGRVSSGFYRTGGRTDDKTIAAIVVAISHPAVVDLLIQEWDLLPAGIRMGVRDRLNGSDLTGNQRKNAQKFNALMKGKILVDRDTRLKAADGRKVNQAIAGATRKYATYDKADHSKKKS